ncbi:hypothetical protein OG302_03195 [Streptomyces sp. NBC_01283]|uniref:hypothetical protein n=1 Tax=Streptomyces sp. NBC_01283 TaxID=2903812 RepID=UPI00352EF6E9|nr:hypothetical protein OG302_03195 [Streptomyces sp. NBC_01283]
MGAGRRTTRLAVAAAVTLVGLGLGRDSAHAEKEDELLAGATTPEAAPAARVP